LLLLVQELTTSSAELQLRDDLLPGELLHGRNCPLLVRDLHLFQSDELIEKVNLLAALCRLKLYFKDLLPDDFCGVAQ